MDGTGGERVGLVGEGDVLALEAGSDVGVLGLVAVNEE